MLFEETLDTVFYIMYNTAVERNTCFIDLLKNRYCKHEDCDQRRSAANTLRRSRKVARYAWTFITDVDVVVQISVVYYIRFVLNAQPHPSTSPPHARSPNTIHEATRNVLCSPYASRCYEIDSATCNGENVKHKPYL